MPTNEVPVVSLVDFAEKAKSATPGMDSLAHKIRTLEGPALQIMVAKEAAACMGENPSWSAFVEGKKRFPLQEIEKAEGLEFSRMAKAFASRVDRAVTYYGLPIVKEALVAAEAAKAAGTDPLPLPPVEPALAAMRQCKKDKKAEKAEKAGNASSPSPSPASVIGSDPITVEEDKAADKAAAALRAAADAAPASQAEIAQAISSLPSFEETLASAISSLPSFEETLDYWTGSATLQDESEETLEGMRVLLQAALSRVKAAQKAAKVRVSVG